MFYKLHIQRLDSFAKKEIKPVVICIICCNHFFDWANVNNIFTITDSKTMFFAFLHKVLKIFLHLSI